MDARIKRVSARRKAASAFLPWVWRLAAAFLAGQPIGLRDRPRDEALATLRCVVELIQARPWRRPSARRRRAA
jgi:hypothetical protein